MDDSRGDLMALSVRGKIIRKIAWLAPRNFEVYYYRDGLAQFLDLDGHVGTLKRHLRAQRVLRDEQIAERWSDLRGEVLRTLLADGAFGHVQPLPEKMRELESVLSDENKIVDNKRRLDAGEHVPNPRRWRESYQLLEKLWGWGLISQKKVMFTTKVLNGDNRPGDINLGLAASAVKVHDVIAVLHRSKVPVVLRPTEENRWTMISQCYLEDCMYGSDPKGNVWWKEKDADFFNMI